MGDKIHSGQLERLEGDHEEQKSEDLVVDWTDIKKQKRVLSGITAQYQIASKQR